MSEKSTRGKSVDMSKMPGTTISVGDQLKNAGLGSVDTPAELDLIIKNNKGPIDTLTEVSLTTDNQGPVDTAPEQKKARYNAPEKTSEPNQDSMDIDTQQPSL